MARPKKNPEPVAAEIVDTSALEFVETVPGVGWSHRSPLFSAERFNMSESTGYGNALGRRVAAAATRCMEPYLNEFGYPTAAMPDFAPDVTIEVSVRIIVPAKAEEPAEEPVDGE